MIPIDLVNGTGELPREGVARQSKKKMDRVVSEGLLIDQAPTPPQMASVVDKPRLWDMSFGGLKCRLSLAIGHVPDFVKASLLSSASSENKIPKLCPQVQGDLPEVSYVNYILAGGSFKAILKAGKELFIRELNQEGLGGEVIVMRNLTIAKEAYKEYYYRFHLSEPKLNENLGKIDDEWGDFKELLFANQNQ